MKHFICILFFCTLLINCNSQTISPNVHIEFCPNVEYTFTVTITKPYSGILGINGCTVTQPPSPPVGTTFTFKGKFGDMNQKQTFQISHPDLTVTPFEFKKIKSLFYSATAQNFPYCNVIVPNQIQPVVFPRCQVSNATISFPNIKWFTNFENPELCFGAVTDYEYLLPAGWSIGSNTSNGSNWIPGGNSVVVTSDLSTGDGAYINIRASNRTCGVGLAANGPVSTVLISRPAPSMSITPGGNQAYICSGSKTFTLVGLPANATVTSWNTSNTLLATVPPNSTGTSVSVTKAGGDGTVVLTANVSQCSYTYQVPVTVNLGTYVPAVYNISSNYVSSTNNQFQYYTYPYEYGLGQVYQPKNQNVLFTTVIDNSFLTNPTWSVSGTYSLFYSSSNTASLYMTTPNTGPYSRNTATVRLLANSGCGSIDKRYVFDAIVSGGYSYSMVASPNPAHGNINVSIKKMIDTSSNKVSSQLSGTEKISPEKTVFTLYDLNYRTEIKRWSYDETDGASYNLNIRGIKQGWYVLKMERGNKTTTTKIFIQ